MFAVAFNPNVITLSANEDFKFDQTLPARLSGVIPPAEFSRSIERCNTAYAPTSLRVVGQLMAVGGIFVWIAFLAVFTSQASSGNPQPGFMVGGFGGMIFLLIGGSSLVRWEQKQRNNQLAAAIAVEHSGYNSEARAQHMGNLQVSMRWAMGTEYRRKTQVANIQIELGNAPAARMAAPMAFMPGYPQPAGYGGAVAATPVYGAPAATPFVARPIAPAQAWAGNTIAVAAASPPPLPATPGYYPGMTAEGAQAPQQTGGATVFCTQCGKAAVSATDRFCAGCGGTIQR